MQGKYDFGRVQERGDAPVGTGLEGAPLCGAGMNPPFLFVLTKRNGPFTVQRETAWADQLDTLVSS